MLKRILIIEDDFVLNKTLNYSLTSSGYDVTSTTSANNAINLLDSIVQYDLILLDINLPDGDGYNMCKYIKCNYPDIIIIFITGNDLESDQIKCYELGAIDYIIKPFSIEVLLRKIKALSSALSPKKVHKDIYDDGTLFLDFSERYASILGKEVHLSTTEFNMLNLLRNNPQLVLTRQQILEKLWDSKENFVDEHTLTTTISRIRNKIEKNTGTTYIKTIYGMGYMWTGGEKR